MGEQFKVDHNKYGDVNMGLVTEVGRMDTVMHDLNQTLLNFGQASGGKATPLWEEQQNQWNKAYQEMKYQLNMHTQSSIRVGDIYFDGDGAGARAMM
jgi:hypothetical protein